MKFQKMNIMMDIMMKKVIGLKIHQMMLMQRKKELNKMWQRDKTMIITVKTTMQKSKKRIKMM